MGKVYHIRIMPVNAARASGFPGRKTGPPAKAGGPVSFCRLFSKPRGRGNQSVADTP